jgi:hypothetical protein
MTDPSELVVVGAFSHPHEAHLACSPLEAAGLDATVADAHIVAADWLVSNAVGGVKVLVRAEDSAEAHEVLESAAVVDRDESRSGDSGEERVARSCPRCGSESIVRVTRGRRFAIASWLIAGVPLFPVWQQQRCRTCGLAVDW